MMAPPALRRQPLQPAGRYRGMYRGRMSVPSTGLPQRHDLTVKSGPVGRLPELSSGARVISWESSLPSLNPRSMTLIVPNSVVSTWDTYVDTLVPSQPQLPASGSPLWDW